MPKNIKQINYNNITFTKKDVALILNCQSLTISNREKNGKYPNPTRNKANNYRIYTLADIFLLQMITYQHIILPPIMSLLYDKGYTDAALIEKILNSEFKDFKERVDQLPLPLPAPIAQVLGNE